MPHLESLHDAAETQHSQINIFLKKHLIYVGQYKPQSLSVGCYFFHIEEESQSVKLLSRVWLFMIP